MYNLWQISFRFFYHFVLRRNYHPVRSRYHILNGLLFFFVSPYQRKRIISTIHWIGYIFIRHDFKFVPKPPINSMCNVLVLLACIPNDEVTNIIEDIKPVHKYLFKCILCTTFPSSCIFYDGSTSSF